MKAVVLALCIGLVLAGRAIGVEPESKAVKLPHEPSDELIFLEVPTGDDFVHTMPGNDFAPVPGGAVIDCVISDTGRFTDCKVLGERPPNIGFADAALELSKRFRVKTVDKDGKSVVGRHRIQRLIWRIEN